MFRCKCQVPSPLLIVRRSRLHETGTWNPVPGPLKDQGCVVIRMEFLIWSQVFITLHM